MEELRVVCIEDEPPIADLVKAMLGINWNAIIYNARNGKEGLALVEQVKPDIVILDLMMPVMSGEEVYRRMKAEKELAHIPIVILTAKAETARELDFLTKADGCVHKPIDPSAFDETIERVLKGRRWE
jgi:CheY-like chemotaxis protein